jgi:ubiquinone/menaquinone biosynthesis C-methylase UbiE
MLNLLRSKCAPYLRKDDQGSGVIAIKQHITSLFGFPDNSIDNVIMNNVLYSVSDPSSCLNEVHRVLRQGGELRISGPKKDTKLDVLFNRINDDLKKSPEFANLRNHYDRVKRINELYLMPKFFRWTVQDVKQMLSEAGFSDIYYSDDKAYAGQAMVVCARKT